VVAPLRVARGIQNKVLEAMAMAKPVVATTEAAAALSGRPGVEYAVAGDAAGFAATVCELLESPRGEAMGRLARERVLRDYTWAASQRRLDGLLEQVADAAEVATPERRGAVDHACPSHGRDSYKWVTVFRRPRESGDPVTFPRTTLGPRFRGDDGGL
jgi:hypothetical protein